MKSNYTVYTHTFPNGKKYVGITKQPIANRWGKHGNNYKRLHQPKMFDAIMKYGWDNITHEIIAEGLTKEQASEKEIELIKLLHSHITENGYNVEWGGYRKRTVSEETRNKLSKASKGRKHSEETRKKMSESAKGRKHSEEAKMKVSRANKGKTISEENRKKISELHKGKVVSEETRQKLAKAQTGKKYSEESRKKMSESHKKSKNT